jgi:hypothetical protein
VKPLDDEPLTDEMQLPVDECKKIFDDYFRESLKGKKKKEKKLTKFVEEEAPIAGCCPHCQ